MKPFNSPRIPPTLSRAESETLVKLLTLHFAYPLAYPLAGAYFEEIFAQAVGGKRETRKLLFDLLREGTGWSLKTHIRSNVNTGSSFEVVVQRCDILRNRNLTIASPVESLGNAIAHHFNQWAIGSVERQEVFDPRAGFLLRNRTETNFVFFQQRYRLYDPSEVTWRWATEQERSLMGFVADDLVFRWYRSGTQLFGVYRIPNAAYEFKISGHRADLDATLAFFASQGVAGTN